MQRSGSQYGGAGFAPQQQSYGYSGGQYYPQQQQPQPIQQQYSGQQQQQYVSTPYAGTVPFPQPSPFAAPPPLQSVPSQPPVRRPPRTQTPHPHTRRNTSSGASRNGHARPLRPALKKRERSHSASANGTNALAPPISISRSRTHSGAAEHRPRLSTISRTRTNSASRSDPDHLFLSINPPNGLELCNIAFQNTVDELREHIFSMWPAGVSRQVRVKHDWRVRFAGSPWSSKGIESIMAKRMICRIFWVLANQGYVYLTSINTGRAFQSPRLVFIRSSPDASAHFFAMSINSSGTRVTFVDPPAAVANSLGLSLRAAFPHRILNEQTSVEGIFTIILKSGINGMGSDKNLFLAHILKYINDMAFKLDASVPLARRGLFGMNGRKEIWIFKGSETWWNRK